MSRQRGGAKPGQGVKSEPWQVVAVLRAAGEPLYTKQIAEWLGCAVSFSLHLSLERLVREGAITLRRKGNYKYYRLAGAVQGEGEAQGGQDG